MFKLQAQLKLKTIISMSDTKYQITKTVRFKLDPYVVTNESQTEEEKEKALQKETARIKEELLQIRTNSSDEVALNFYLNDKGNDESLSDLKSLNGLLDKAISKLEYLIFKTDGNDNVVKYENKKVWSSIEIKYGFLRSYLKYDFYRFKESKYGLSNEKPPKKYKLDDRDIQFFRDEVVGSEKRIGLIPRLQEIQRSLADFTERQEVRQYEKKRFSDIALVLGDLTKRDNLVFLKSMVSALVIPNNDQKGLDAKKNELVGVIASIEAILIKSCLTLHHLNQRWVIKHVAVLSIITLSTKMRKNYKTRKKAFLKNCPEIIVIDLAQYSRH